MSKPRRFSLQLAPWDGMCRNFRWEIPEAFNIAAVCCDEWAEHAPGKVAIIQLSADGARHEWRYRTLRAEANRLANVLAALGVGRGDRVAVLLGQRAECMVAHLAIYKLGAVALPLFGLFGPDALAVRLADSGAVAALTDAAGVEKLAAIRAALPALAHVLSVDGPGAGAGDWPALAARASDRFETAATGPDDPALMIYTSGTTGAPKGVLHGHRVLIGHLPGLVMHHEGFPQPGDTGWTPADWAWIGGLLDMALPCLYWGVPLIAHRAAKFDPEAAFALIAQEGVRNLFLPPTALRLMRSAPPPSGLAPRTVASGGEPLGADMLDWGRSAFGVTINEFYGQTEGNIIVSSCAAVGAVRPGWMGRAVPGHEVAVIGPDGAPLPAGETGEIALAAPDPVMFLCYWNQPRKTAEKFTGRWMRTGDLGVMDEEGFLRFVAREDDVITSSGYRIGPSEIEACLAAHPDVVMAAVVGIPDVARTEVVTAFIVPRPGAEPGLEAALAAHVRARLSPHMAPRSVVLVESLPMTATGKVQRRVLRETHGISQM